MFNEHGDLINPMGDVAKGRQQILALFQGEQSGALKTSTMAQTCEPARFVAANVALVDCEFTVEGTPGAAGKQHGHMADVVTLEGDRWGIVSMRAMFPRQLAAQPPAATR